MVLADHQTDHLPKLPGPADKRQAGQGEKGDVKGGVIMEKGQGGGSSSSGLPIPVIAPCKQTSDTVGAKLSMQSTIRKNDKMSKLPDSKSLLKTSIISKSMDKPSKESLWKLDKFRNYSPKKEKCLKEATKIADKPKEKKTDRPMTLREMGRKIERSVKSLGSNNFKKSKELKVVLEIEENERSVPCRRCRSIPLVCMDTQTQTPSDRQTKEYDDLFIWLVRKSIYLIYIFIKKKGLFYSPVC